MMYQSPSASTRNVYNHRIYYTILFKKFKNNLDKISSTLKFSKETNT